MDPHILSRQFTGSGYAGSVINTFTDEWIMHVDDDNNVIHCDRDGNDHGWRLYSLSKWQANDSARLRQLLEVEFEQLHHYDIYWDDIAMFDYADQFNLKLLPIHDGDIVEVDSIAQLGHLNAELGKTNDKK